MSFRNINKVFLFLIIFLSYSCKTIEKISKEKDNNIQTINNNYDFEFNEKIFLKKIMFQMIHLLIIILIILIMK